MQPRCKNLSKDVGVKGYLTAAALQVRWTQVTTNGFGAVTTVLTSHISKISPIPAWMKTDLCLSFAGMA